MLLSIEPISDVNHVEDLANIIQIVCLFSAEVVEGDVDWDDDLIFSTFIEARRTEGEDAETISDYESENNRTLQLAKEEMLADVRVVLRERSAAMGVHFPFWIPNESGKVLIRKDFSEIDGSGAAYLWQVLFDLMESDNNYVQLSEADEKDFRSRFHKVFELISCYALAGRSEQHVWYVGKSRSTAKFLDLLRRMARTVGSGSVKKLEDLDDHQRHVNEAGVDGAALTLLDGQVGKDAELVILQSTVQRTQRRNKVVGAGEILRFKEFFIKKPRVAVHGALAIPFESEPIDEAHCAEANCIYLPRREILKYLGREPSGRQRRGTRKLDALIMSHNIQLRDVIKLKTIDGNLSIG